MMKLANYRETLIFGGYLILAIFAIKAKSAEILVRQYHIGSDKNENLMSI